MQKQCLEEQCDGIFIAEAREYLKILEPEPTPWRSGIRPVMELNTGLFLLKPNPKVRHFLQVLLQGVFLQQWRRRDQLYYNVVMWHRNFAHMRWSILPHEYFVPGKRLHRGELLARPLKPRNELYVIHVSDTGNYEIKIRRLKAIDHWYFQFGTCRNPVEACRNILSCWESLHSCDDCKF